MKKRGQYDGYTKRSIESVSSRSVRSSSRSTTPYRIKTQPKKDVAAIDVVPLIKAPTSNNATPSIPVISTKPLSQKPITTARELNTAPTPRKAAVYKKSIHRRAMKHIPTLPAPSRRGLLGIYDKIRKIFIKQKKLTYALACLMLIAAAGWYGYGFYDTKNQRKKEAQYIQSVTVAVNPDAASAYIEIQPTLGNIDLYTVAPTAPRVLTIPKLGILTSIKKVGTSGVNQIANTQNIFEAGWYEASATPGSPGAVTLIANVSGPTKTSPFTNLNKLAKGDTFTVERGDNETIRYVVVATESIAYGRPIMDKVTKSHDPSKEGLNIITGVGLFNRRNKDYVNRLIVYAVRENEPQATQVPTTSR